MCNYLVNVSPVKHFIKSKDFVSKQMGSIETVCMLQSLDAICYCNKRCNNNILLFYFRLWIWGLILRLGGGWVRCGLFALFLCLLMLLKGNGL